MKLLLPLAAAFLFLGAAPPDDLAPMALNSLSSAPAKIALAPVLNQDGRRVGTVKAVVTDQDGRPSALSYTTPDNRLMIVAAPAVSYDGQKNIVVADTSAQQTTDRVAVN
jgi:hypothetical protein